MLVTRDDLPLMRAHSLRWRKPYQRLTSLSPGNGTTTIWTLVIGKQVFQVLAILLPMLGFGARHAYCVIIDAIEHPTPLPSYGVATNALGNGVNDLSVFWPATAKHNMPSPRKAAWSLEPG